MKENKTRFFTGGVGPSTCSPPSVPPVMAPLDPPGFVGEGYWSRARADMGVVELP